MRLRVVERFEVNRGAALLGGEALRVPARLAAHEEWDLLQFGLGLGGPD